LLFLSVWGYYFLFREREIMNKINLASYLLLLVTPGLIVAETLSIKNFLEQVQQNHPFFKKESLNPEILKTQQKALLGGEDWRVNATTSLTHEETGISNAFTPEKANYANLETSLSRLYWKTGGQMSLGYSLTRSSQDFSQGNIKSYQNYVNLQYVHPLMKNINGILSRLNYELEDYNVQNAEILSLEAKENFLAELADKYLDWILQTELLRINNKRLSISETEYKRTKRKRSNNLVPKVDVIRSKHAVLRTKQSLQKVKADLASILADLSVLSQNQNLLNLTPEYQIYDIKTLPSKTKVNQSIANNSRLVNSFQLRLDQIDNQLRGLHNDKKPELDLIVGAGLLGNDSGFGDAASINNPQYSVALNFSYPLGNRNAKANIDQSHLQKMQLEEGKNDLILTLQAAAAAILERLSQLEKSLELDKAQIESSKLKTREELKRYNQGRSELTFVLQSQDQEQQAEISYAITAITYHKIYLRYRALMDELLSTSNNKKGV